ncbi:MAG: HEAT repeat domain-containing protein [Anaerolineae bacterium]|nr:HEAT repeat domain-containing protein [Anaerolineae bacterium]
MMTPTMSPFEQEATVETWMTRLHSHDAVQRQEAYHALVGLGKLALPALVDAMTDGDDRVRFEAAKALVEIHDPKAVPALIGALEDERSPIRWVAAEGLTRLGSASRGPLLHALIEHSDSVLLREGAHHILRCWSRLGWGDEVGPVLAALEDLEPAVEAPVAAYGVLRRLDNKT